MIKLTDYQISILKEYLLKFKVLENDLRGLYQFGQSDSIKKKKMEADELWNEMDKKINIKSFDYECDANDLEIYTYEIENWLKKN